MRETCGVAWLLFVRAGPLGAFVCGRFRVCRLRFRLALFVLVSRVVCGRLALFVKAVPWVFSLQVSPCVVCGLFLRFCALLSCMSSYVCKHWSSRQFFVGVSMCRLWFLLASSV